MGRKHKSGDDYVEQVQDAFWDATLEGDWVNFRAQSSLSSEIYDAVESARKFMEKGNPEPAIEIGFAIIENDIDLINHNDDSCGYLGTIMRYGLELLHDASKLELDDDNRELFQDYCEDCLKKKTLSGWDWDFDIYECLISLLQTPKEAKQLIKRIEKDESLEKDYNADRHINSYGAEQLAAETATDLRTKYRRYRALIEELDKMTFVSQKQ